jgi:hypothetical protein
MSTEPLLCLAPQAVFRAIADDEACILELGTKSFFSVNATGLEVLEELKRSAKRRSELLTALCQQFDVEPERCGKDLDAFLAELVAAGLLVERTA